MKKILTFLLIFFITQNNFSQAFLSNNSALVSIKNSALLSVQGDIYIEKNGIFDNSDTIKLTGDFTNNAGNIGFNPINKGYVYLIGANERINGTDETHFYNLLLRNTGIKYGDLDVYVHGFLDLDSLELSLDTNIVYVTDEDLNAVVNNEGFVSSLVNGGLSRATNQNDDYLFPVGSSIYGKIYRPIDIKTTNSPQEYRVRFTDEDPGNDNLDRENRDILICDINDVYYHKIWQDLGNDSSDIRFYFKSVIDGSHFNELVHWEGEPKWYKAPADTLLNNSAWDLMEVYNWNNYNSENFALAFGKEHFADAGADQTIYLLDTVQLIGSGGNYYNWTPAPAVSCPDCPEPFFWDDTTQVLVLEVLDDDNCTDFDTVKITVDERFSEEEGMFIPDGITPNGDGVNDSWYIRWLYRYPDNEVIIVNRWEDIIYRAGPYNNNWVGTYNDQNLPEGTYYFILRIKENGELIKTYTGPLTIIK